MSKDEVIFLPEELNDAIERYLKISKADTSNNKSKNIRYYVLVFLILALFLTGVIDKYFDLNSLYEQCLERKNGYVNYVLNFVIGFDKCIKMTSAWDVSTI